MIREDLDRNFGFLVNDVARLLRTTYDRRMRELGLTRSQWWVLTHLYRNEGRTQSELADVMELERASLGRLLDRLESNGWVRREADTQDRRAKRVYLAQSAGPTMNRMREIAAELRRDALDGISESDREHFVDILMSVKQNLGDGTQPCRDGSEKKRSGETESSRNGAGTESGSENARA